MLFQLPRMIVFDYKLPMPRDILNLINAYLQNDPILVLIENIVNYDLSLLINVTVLDKPRIQSVFTLILATPIIFESDVRVLSWQLLESIIHNKEVSRDSEVHRAVDLITDRLAEYFHRPSIKRTRTDNAFFYEI